MVAHRPNVVNQTSNQSIVIFIITIMSVAHRLINFAMYLVHLAEIPILKFIIHNYAILFDQYLRLPCKNIAYSWYQL